MRILFDENLDWRLRHLLTGHEVATVQALGLSGTKNGELLRQVVCRGFDVFLTLDDNLSYQHDLSQYHIAIVVLRVRRNRLKELSPLVPRLLEILSIAPQGRRTELKG